MGQDIRRPGMPSRPHCEATAAHFFQTFPVAHRNIRRTSFALLNTFREQALPIWQRKGLQMKNKDDIISIKKN